MQETPFITKKQPNHTLSKIAFLLLSLPLGIFYFTAVTVGLSVGIGTVIIWVGIPVLFVTFAFLWGMAALERAMAGSMLDVSIPARRPRYGQRSLQQRFKEYLRDCTTWSGLAYALFIKMPLGIFSFTVLVTFLAVSLSFLLMPLVYLLLTHIYNAVGSHDPHWNLIGGDGWAYIRITGHYDIIDFMKSFALTAVGIPFLWLTVHIVNWLAALSGTIIRVLLSPTDQLMDAPKSASSVYQPQPRYNEGYQPSQPPRYNEGYQGYQEYQQAPRQYATQQSYPEQVGEMQQMQ